LDTGLDTIAESNKNMKPTTSDTPRTDAAKIHANSINTVKLPPSEFVVTADFACELEIKLGEWKDMAQKLAYHVQCNDSWCGIRNSKCDACEVLETFKQLDAPAEPSNR